MFLLVALILIGAAVTYGIFFLLFKLIWIWCKKEGNKWPLILSGILTGLTWLGLFLLFHVAMTMLVAPFQGIVQDIAKNPAPVYGERTYQDTTYPVALDVFDGIQFSDWITFDKAAVKIGVDTNVFKAKDKKLLTALLLVRSTTTNKGPENTFAEIDGLLGKAQQQRRLEVNQKQQLTLQGKPAYFITGVASTNQGMADLAGVALYNNTQEVYYLVAFNLGEKADNAKLEQTVKSLRLMM